MMREVSRAASEESVVLDGISSLALSTFICSFLTLFLSWVFDRLVILHFYGFWAFLKGYAYSICT